MLQNRQSKNLLSFASVEGQFEKYLGALRGNKSQRDSVISELRVGFFLKRNGFPIIQWRPVGANNREGEYQIAVRGTQGIFVEVKAPGWEGELTKDEIKAGRTQEDKHLQYEGRCIAPWERVQFEVDKAYGKFDGSRSNLLVIADDMFVSLRNGTEEQVARALYTSDFFTDTSRENLGGVGIFWEEYDVGGIGYQIRLFLNPHAKRTAALPDSFVEAFKGKAIEVVPSRIPLKKIEPLIILTDL